jgi:hypothetical protein
LDAKGKGCQREVCAMVAGDSVVPNAIERAPAHDFVAFPGMSCGGISENKEDPRRRKGTHNL